MCVSDPDIVLILQLFEKVEQYKPPASRISSAETYLLGFKYKAPVKIDPRLLDMKHLFKAVEPQKKVTPIRGNRTMTSFIYGLISSLFIALIVI